MTLPSFLVHWHLRHGWRFLSLILICVAAPNDFASAASCVSTSTKTAATVTQIAPGIFVREGVHAEMTAENLGGISNASFVIGKTSVAVIDSGGSHCDGLRLKAAIRKHTDLPIKYIINTHVHPDHVFGNGAFEGDGAEFIGHEKLTRALAERGSFYVERFTELMGKDAIAGTKLIPPSKTVSEELHLDLGGRTLTLRAHPTAHTDNDLSVFDDKTKTLWTGDLVFQGHLPVLDGKLLGWFDVLKSLTEIEAARAVPGHGPASIPWPQGAEPQQRYFNALAKDIRKSIENGEFMQEAQEKAGQSEKDKWKLFDAFNARNAAGAFAELEWE